MAMGFRPQRKGLFGAQTPMTAPNGTPPIRDPQQDMGSPMGMPGLGMAQQPTTEKKAGFFGEGGAGRMIAGSIGDMLLHNAGMAPMYFPLMQQQREAAAQQAAAQRKRAEDFADWRQREDYQRANRPPPSPTLREDNAGNVWQFDPQSGQPMGDKPVWIDPTEKVIYQDGMQIRVPNPYRTGAAQAPQIAPGTIDSGYRFKGGDPADKNNWEPATGGGGGNVTANFLDGF